MFLFMTEIFSCITVVISKPTKCKEKDNKSILKDIFKSMIKVKSKKCDKVQM